MMQLQSTWCHGSLGRFLVIGDESLIYGIWREGQRHFARGWSDIPDVCPEQMTAQPLRLACEWLRRYAEGMRPSPQGLPLCEPVSNIARSVHRALLDIPYGETVSYKELAQRCGRPGAVRAVATAVARNRFLLLVPCHRVIGSDGNLRGYAAGLALQRRLLEEEGAWKH